MASTSAAIEKKKMFNLKSSDGNVFQLDEAAASMSLTIKNMIEDFSDGEDIPLPNVDGATLAKVCEYCKRHTAPPENETVSEFDKKLVEELKVDQPMLFDLILAANYLSLTQLLNLTCQCVADMIKGKDADEIRKLFHIKNDYTDEELEEVKRENRWAFE